MQPYLYPAIAAIAAGGAALLVSGSLPVAIGAGVGCAIGIWIVEKRKNAPPR